MKIYVCDVCKKEGKLTETTRYTSLRGVQGSRLDLCEKHRHTPPKAGKEYIKFVYKTIYNEELSDEMAMNLTRVRR